ncbi:DUF3325 domain-containing protein [Halopseudomonas oceani]|uniref:DUF3325 domain-containing protein n=1 Tax=Halopseudomonas oceani TaxID=1708783 RepID=UPI002AA86F44|nr:DUF3325 domain-containing protein [Halopseudomonas oceani]
MTDTLWLVCAALLMLLATCWLALSLQSHWRQVFARTDATPATKRLRVAGWTALLLSALCCLKADHPSMAVLVWFTLFSAAAMTTSMLLSYRPLWLRLVCLPLLRLS